MTNSMTPLLSTLGLLCAVAGAGLDELRHLAVGHRVGITLTVVIATGTAAYRVRAFAARTGKAAVTAARATRLPLFAEHEGLHCGGRAVTR